MFSYRLLSLSVLLLFLAGCQTVADRYGKGNFELSPKLHEAYLKYLAINSMPKTKGQNSVFIVDTIYNSYRYGSGGNHVSEVANRLLKECHEGCKIFAVNRRIVWQGYENAKEFESYKLRFEKYANYPLKYAKDYPWYDVTSQQKRRMGNIDDEGTYHKAVAVSVDGKSVGRYMMQNSRWFRRHTLERLAQVSCLAASNGQECFLYSFDGETY